MAQEKSELMSKKVVILGTGGTIAGLSLVPGAGGAYKAAQVSVDQLVAQARTSDEVALVTEQLAQVDSKDMTHALWQRLLSRMHQLQHDPDVVAIVITHGTDTLEETGFVLQACWPQGKLVVMTCAMRPADAPDADGPSNLRDAIALARTPGLSGVLMVCDGQVFEGHVFQKVRTDGVQPFGADPLGPLGVYRDGKYRALRQVDRTRAYTALLPHELQQVLTCAAWPRVEIVFNHAGSDGWGVSAWLKVSAQSDDEDCLRGIVLAGTGQGTCSERLESALRQAQATGVVIWRSTRATWGTVRSVANEEFRGVPWSPVKARIALMLDMLTARV
jgi:L-asparaginase